MEPYEPLAMEHRLIERFFAIIEKEINRIRRTSRVNTAFISTLTDFFVTYIDIYHHGKEENILFKKMERKKLTMEHRKMMLKLLDEHKLGRRVIEELMKSADAYASGDQNEMGNIIARFQDFIKLYTQHINEEDHSYFMDCMDYFTESEKEEIIQDFWRYTIKLMDKKYEEIIRLLEES